MVVDGDINAFYKSLRTSQKISRRKKFQPRNISALWKHFSTSAKQAKAYLTFIVTVKVNALKNDLPCFFYTLQAVYDEHKNAEND